MINFSIQDCEYWLNKNLECWQMESWETINDKNHINSVSRLHSPEDKKFIYDSYIWSKIIEDFIPKACIKALELLPGTSLTIPGALQSAGFNGELLRFDSFHNYSLYEENLEINSKWILGDLNSFDKKMKFVNLILGNHIIDDIIYNKFLYEKSVKINWTSDKHYSDALLNRKTWLKIVNEIKPEYFSNFILTCLTRTLLNCNKDCVMILRHYPSTFSLRNKDIYQINYVEKVYYDICQKLKKRFKLIQPCLDNYKVPLGSKYPNSFIIIYKKHI